MVWFSGLRAACSAACSAGHGKDGAARIDIPHTLNLRGFEPSPKEHRLQELHHQMRTREQANMPTRQTICMVGGDKNSRHAGGARDHHTRHNMPARANKTEACLQGGEERSPTNPGRVAPGKTYHGLPTNKCLRLSISGGFVVPKVPVK